MLACPTAQATPTAPVLSPPANGQKGADSAKSPDCERRVSAIVCAKGSLAMLHIVRRLPPRVQIVLFVLSLAALAGGVFLLISQP